MRDLSHFTGPFWPPEQFLTQRRQMYIDEVRAFRELIEEGASEKAVDRFIRRHPHLLGGCAHFDRVNPHASWVIPQASIRPPLTTNQRGLRPDYLVGGCGSDGVTWCVVELKSPRDTIFVTDRDGTGLRLSGAANRGICQLLSYLDYCAANQAYLREFLHAARFREPRGMLFIGRRTELENDLPRQELRAMLNRSFAGRIEIRTFDALDTSTVFAA